MIMLVRVDDRLLHGQIVCAWVPYLKATSLVVASDDAAGDSLASEIMESCGHEGLKVHVESVAEASRDTGFSGVERVILVVGDIKDAMRVYDGGLKFSSINIGNVHHEDGGRRLSPSVMLDAADEEMLERFKSLGVEIDIRDVPASASVLYASRR